MSWPAETAPLPVVPVSANRARSLRRANLLAALVHAASAAAVLALANGFTLPVTGTYLVGPPGSAGETVTVLDLSVAGAVTGFLLLSALFHLLVSAPGMFERYLDGLAHQRNVFRWVEYSLSSSLMIVVIAQLCGITDIAALLAIAGVNASMILFGWLQETYHQPGDGGWLPFVFGCIAGVVPWAAIVVYVAAPGSTSAAQPPGFVYAIIVSLFVFFNVFAVVQWLQYRPVGRFADYLVGERAYIVLSFLAKSALAWQVFAGTLAA
jgi:hypothetical protein